MTKTKKIFTSLFSAIIAFCMAIAIFLAFPADGLTASAYDEVGPSFDAEKTVTFDKAAQYDIRNNVVYGLSSSVLDSIVNYDTVTLDIPSGVTSIAENAFFSEDNYGRRIIKVVLPDTLTTIGKGAFNACQKMLHIQIGAGVTNIESNAFNYCYKLVEIYNRSKLNFTCGSTDHGRIAENALNIYTASSGSSQLAKTADNYYFCKYTSGTARVLATQTGTDVNYTQNRWYLVCGEHIMGKQNKLPDPEGGNFAVNYVIKSGNDGISSYDINRRAFWMSYATFVEIPNCINVIGDFGFGFALNYTIKFKSGGTGTLAIGSQALFLFSSISTSDADSPYFDPEIGAASRFGQEIYLTNRPISCAADSFYSPVIASTNIHSAIIYPDYTTYNSNRSQINGGNATVPVRGETATATIAHYETYLIDINYNIYDRDNALLETVTEKRLYRGPQTKWGYNYVEGQYGYRANTAYNDIPNVKNLKTIGSYDYDKTLWYQTAPSNGLGSLATVNWINGLLGTAGRTSIDLHMKYIEKPELTMINEEWDYTGYSYNIENLDTLLQGTPIALTSGWNVDAVITRGGVQVDYVRDVGEYVLTLHPTDAFKEKYGDWESEPSVTFKINKAKVDLTNSANFRLEFANGSGEQLQSGMVYVYRESGGLQVPYTSPQDGKELDGTHDTTWSYIRNKADMPDIEILSIPVNAYVSSEYMYTASGYSTLPAVNGVGVYSTSVTISPTSNYEFADPQYSQEIAKRGLAFRNNGDGTYTVTKTWYVVAISNWFVVDDTGESSEDYFTENLEYGAVPSFGTPHLAHGGQNYIQFKLIYTDSHNSVTDVTGSEPNGGYANYGDFGKYVNCSMPVGRYSLTFKADEYVDSSDGTAYPEFSTTYEFSVTNNQKLKDEYSQTIDAALQGKEFRYQYDGSYHLFSGEEVVNTVNGVLKTAINNRTDVWANSAYDKYYSSAFTISYNLYRMRTNDYYTEERLATSGYAPLQPDTYTIYYQVTALNYEDMVAVSDDTARREFYFTVFIYDYVEIPYISVAAQKAGLVYTGSSVMPVVQGSDKYSVNWSNTDVYINAGEHTFNLNMLDSVHYYWKLPAATEGVTAEDINANVTIGFNNDSSQNGTVTIKYCITKAENVWNSTPNVISWAWNSFVPSANIINAVPRHNSYLKDNATLNVDVSFIIFKEDKTAVAVPEFRTVNGVVTDSAVIDALNALDAGRYYLVAIAEETDNFFGINTVADGEPFAPEAFFEFNISQAINRWASTPNIIRWTWDRFDANEHIITATPEFGEYIGDGAYLKVNYYIYRLVDGEKVFLTYGAGADGKDIIYFNTEADGKVPANVASVLRTLDAGTYYLIANVPSTANYTGINEIEIKTSETEDGSAGEETVIYPEGSSFAIFKAANRWDKSPSMTGWMWNRFSSDNVEVIAEPAYKTKSNGDVAAIAFRFYSAYDAANPDSNVALTKPFSLVDGKLPEKITLEDGTEVTTAIWLNSLDQGNYYLVATVEDGGNFESLTDSAIVTVSVLTNSWVYTPSIDGWEWSGFSAANNTVKSTPLFNGTEFFADDNGYAAGQVKYYIYKENASGVKVLVEGFEDGFFADANGAIVDSDGAIASLLNALPAGRYFLLATVAADESAKKNYTGINTDGNLDYISFSVAQAKNQWTNNPSIVAWQYGNFDADINTVYSLPALTQAGEEVKYQIFGSKEVDGKTVIDESNAITEVFSGNNIALDAEVANKLPRGTYYVRANYAGNNNFAAIVNDDYAFRIYQATNTFTVSPNVKQWTWDEYDPASNKILALPEFYDAKDGVTFQIFKNDENKTLVFEFDINDNGALAAADGNGKERGEVDLSLVTVKNDTRTVARILDGLDAGSYVLRVVVQQDANGNYTAINVAGRQIGEDGVQTQADIEYIEHIFSIKQATNTWVQSPNVAPWNWSDYNPADYKITALPRYYNTSNPTDLTFTVLDGAKNTLVKFKVATEGGSESALDKDTGVIDLTKVTVTEVNSKYTVPDGENAVEYILGSLDADTYYLLVEVDGTNNYSDINIGLAGEDAFTPDYRPFAVLIKTNTWVKNPNVVQWKWGDFDKDVNVVSALPEFYAASDVNFTIEQVTATGNILKKQFGIASDALDKDTGVIDFTKIEGLEAALSALDAGNYRMLVTVDGTQNYTGLNVNDSPDYFAFNIAQATNTWDQSPTIKSWTWGSYAAAVNTIASKPRHGAVKEYGIYVKNGENYDLLFTVPVADLNNGVLTEESLIEGLKGLDKGDYYILGIVDESVNYTGLNDIAGENGNRDFIPFEVYQATNEWKTSPSVVNWSYGGYRAEFNLVTAQPALYEGNIIKYRLFRDDSGNSPITGEFTVTADNGVFPSAVISEWISDNLANTLDAGTYYLYAEYAASLKDNFTALSGYFEFSVLTATNTWIQSPSIKSWTWGSYASETNVITSSPKFGVVKQYGIYVFADGAYTLKFTVSADDIGENGVLKEGSASKAEFEKLDAATYYILGIVDADSNAAVTNYIPNYTGLNLVGSEDYIEFNVYQATNEWKTSPTVTAWAYKNYVSNENTVIALPNLLSATTIKYQILDENKQAISKEFTATLTGGAFNAAQILWESGKDGNSFDAGVYYLKAVYEGNTNFTRLENEFEFRILQASNSWETTPNVINWYYGGFVSATNTVTSLPRFTADGDKVVYKILGPDGEELTAANGFEVENYGAQFTGSIVWKDGVNPDELAVGTYKLQAFYPESNNYYKLETEHEFTILKATNSFKYSPKVVSWVWGEYNSSNNFISALPEFYTAAGVTFSVLDAGKNILQKFGITENSALATADGRLDITKIADNFDLAAYLKGLNAGEYFLLVTVAGNDNYTDINVESQDPISFTVQKAPNGFTYSPRVVQWTWGEYSDGINFVYVLPEHFNAPDVLFTLLDSDKTTKIATFGIKTKDALSQDGKLDWDGITDFEVAEGFAATTLAGLFEELHAREYFLLVEVKEDSSNQNWAGINVASKDPISFTVNKATNRWSQSPAIVGWNYGGFSNTVNTLSAVPLYSGQDSTSVRYQLFAAVDGEEVAMTKEMTVAKINGKFGAYTIDSTDWINGYDPNKLNVGTYTLKAWYEGCEDYTDILVNEFTFAVSPATNTWLLSPKVNNWIWNEYDATKNVISATPALSDENVTYRIYKRGEDAGQESDIKLSELVLVGSAFTKRIGNTVIQDTEVIDLLKGLGAGRYYLLATVNGDANYTGINLLNSAGTEAEIGYSLDFIEFEVYAKENYWVESPKIVQWVWGSYNAEQNLITAEPFLINKSGEEGASTKNGDYVKFFVYDGNYNLISSLKGFTTADGIVPENIASALAELTAGTYYLVGAVGADGNGNFTSLDFVDETVTNIQNNTGLLRVQFTIGLAVNYWMETPNMNSWTWGEFSVTDNAISARPYLINGEKTTDGDNAYLGNIEFAVYGTAAYETAEPIIEAFKLIKSGNNWVVPNNIRIALESLEVSENYYYLVGKVAGENGKYLSISMPHAFRVQQATNYWTKSPAIDSWTYGSYDFTANAIYAAPYYYTDMDDREVFAQSKVTYTVYETYIGAGDEGNKVAESKDNALKGFVLTRNANGLWVVSNPVKEALNALDAGNYVLVSEVDGTKNFTNLIETESFTVYQVENGWSTAPRISFWYYGQFNATNNAISAVPNYPATGAEVTYAVYKGNEKLTEFTHAAGTVTYTKEVTDILSELDRGVYRLCASVKGTTNFSDITDYYVEFEVAQAINSWNLSPKIVSWTYGGFDSDYNVISATPRYLPANSKIIYTVYGSKGEDKVIDTENVVAQFYYGGSGTVQYNLITDEHGTSIVNSLYSKFGSLDAGRYYLLAQVPEEDNGNGNWSGINLDNPVYIEFEIAQADNYWEISPIIIPWQYGAYSKTENSISARPHFYEGENFDPASVTYSIYAGSYSPEGNNQAVIGLSGFRLEKDADGNWVVSDAVVSRLNVLGTTVDYFLEGVAEGAGNYKQLVSVNSFRVQKLQNYWTVTPTISSWTWAPDLVVPNNVISALPFRGNSIRYYIQTSDEYIPGTEQTYTDVEGLEGGFASITQPSNVSAPTGGVYLVRDVIARLNRGTYYLYVVVSGEDNYTGLEQRVSFEVIQAQNYWDKSPSVSSWTWDNEERINLDPANLVSAVPHFGTAVNISIYSGDEKLKFNNGAEEVDSFVFTGSVPDYVIAELKKLGAGSYSLETSVPSDENGNWSGISAAKVNFTVTSATNYFVSTPNIIRWTYNGYSKAINVVSAEPYFKLEGKAVTYRIYYLNSNNERVYVTSEFNAEANGEIPDDAWGDVDPNTLHAGADRVYYMLASYEGNGNNFAPITTTVNFYILTAQNIWEVTPNIMDWTYNLAGNVNAPSARPRFGAESDVKFTYYVFDESAANYAGDLLDGAPSAAGRYVLRAQVDADADGNYNALDSYVVFNVNAAQNYWVIQPTVRNWAWNGFDIDVNTITAQPYLGSVQFRICTLTDGRYVPLTFDGYTGGIVVNGNPDNTAFTVDANGKVPAGIVNTLKNLPAGRYYLIATVLSDGNYTGINNQLSGGEGAYLDPVMFEISKANDSWTTQPQASGWTYGSDPADLSAIARAEANYAGNAVTFKYFKATVNNAGVANMVNGRYEIDNTIPGNVNGFDSMTAFLKDGAIPVGAYVVQAFTSGSDNFTPLDTQLVFYVAKANNNWTTPPSISTWVYGEYDPAKNSVTAVSRFGSVLIEIRTAAGTPVALFGSGHDFNNLKDATAGNYVMSASVEESENYYGLESEIMFTIFTNDQTLTRNYWTVTPQIQGWTYGDTPNQYKGEARYGKVTFEFRNAKDEVLANQDPSSFIAGNYIMVVTATPSATELAYGLTERIEFTVAEKKLKVNGWKTVPKIDNWVEGEEESVPVAEANFGEISYEYFDVAGNLLDAKPTEAGTYYIRVTATAEGYEDLVSNLIGFTIESNEVNMLMFVDVILGGIAFVLCTIVVVLYIIRRKRI